MFSSNLPFPLSRLLTQGEQFVSALYLLGDLIKKSLVREKRASPKNNVQCYHSTEIKLEVGRIPCTRNRTSLQGLKLVCSISKGLCHSKKTRPLGG